MRCIIHTSAVVARSSSSNMGSCADNCSPKSCMRAGSCGRCFQWLGLLSQEREASTLVRCDGAKVCSLRLCVQQNEKRMLWLVSDKKEASALEMRSLCQVQ